MKVFTALFALIAIFVGCNAIPCLDGWGSAAWHPWDYSSWGWPAAKLWPCGPCGSWAWPTTSCLSPCTNLALGHPAVISDPIVSLAAPSCNGQISVEKVITKPAVFLSKC